MTESDASSDAEDSTDSLDSAGPSKARAKLSARRFLLDRSYREREGLPLLRASVTKAWRSMATETRESFQAVGHLASVAEGRGLNATERKQLQDQLQDLAKAVPMLAIFLLPGGMILLPILLKILPFDLRLSGFKDDAEIEEPVSELADKVLQGEIELELDTEDEAAVDVNLTQSVRERDDAKNQPPPQDPPVHS
ncbi:MAG: LETM1 domain-containing protein [Planctomycetota bacterium]